MSNFKLLLLGATPIAALFAALFMVRHYAGSWETFFTWGFSVMVGVMIIALLVAASYTLGYKLWYGKTSIEEPGKGGISRIVQQRETARIAKATARAAAKAQDGQVSVASDEQGRVAVVR